MDAPKLWKEVLFLLIPFLAFMVVSLMVGCGSLDTAWGELRMSPAEVQALEAEQGRPGKTAQRSL